MYQIGDGHKKYICNYEKIATNTSLEKTDDTKLGQVIALDTILSLNMMERSTKLSNSAFKNDVESLRQQLKLQNNDRGIGIATRLLQLSEGSIERAKLAVDTFLGSVQTDQENDTIESIITDYIKDMGRHRTNYAAIMGQTETDRSSTMVPGSILYTKVNYNMPAPTWKRANKELALKR